MSKSVLIIGGTGFFGSALREVLNADDNFDVSITSTEGGSSDSSHLALDLLDPTSAKQILGYDIVINLSGQMSQPENIGLELNTTGVSNALCALKDSDTLFVQMSSAMVYGPMQIAKEDSPLSPQSPYASAKAQAEKLIQQAIPKERYLILRLCNLFGPNQTKGLLWFVLQSTTQENGIEVHDNNGELRRHFLHITDAACILRDLLKANASGILNVAGEQSLSIKELVTLCEEITGESIPAKYGESSPSDTIENIDISMLKGLTDIKFKHSVKEYLSEELSKG